MPALNRSDRLANDLGPLYMKSLAEKLTGSDVIDNYALEQLYGHLKEVGEEREKAADTRRANQQKRVENQHAHYEQ